MALPAQGYRIRPLGADDDLGSLAALEVRSAKLFGSHGHPAIADAPERSLGELESFFAGNTVWIAASGEVPVGFAMAGVVGTAFYLKELSVDPDHGKRGIGAALLENYVEHARRLGFRFAALSTFGAIPFNAPFYARHGFVIVPLDAAAEELRVQFRAEVPAGIDPQSRVLMVRSL